ncbi:PDZ domain-containing protein [Cupriavidus numazuensis]|uniref:PDZ domain-containing protein n=1 Tax=Cupriavidus numazuensis TaxID=221992 RepID=UPI0036096EBF
MRSVSKHAAPQSCRTNPDLRSQPGDLILRLNDVPVQGVSQLESLLKSHQGKSVALLVRRGPDTLFLALQVPSAE